MQAGIIVPKTGTLSKNIHHNIFLMILKQKEQLEIWILKTFEKRHKSLLDHYQWQSNFKNIASQVSQ